MCPSSPPLGLWCLIPEFWFLIFPVSVPSGVSSKVSKSSICAGRNQLRPQLIFNLSVGAIVRCRPRYNSHILPLLRNTQSGVFKMIDYADDSDLKLTRVDMQEIDLHIRVED